MNTYLHTYLFHAFICMQLGCQHWMEEEKKEGFKTQYNSVFLPSIVAVKSQISYCILSVSTTLSITCSP